MFLLFSVERIPAKKASQQLQSQRIGLRITIPETHAQCQRGGLHEETEKIRAAASARAFARAADTRIVSLHH